MLSFSEKVKHIKSSLCVFILNWFRETLISYLPSACTLTRELNLLGMCPDRELNLPPCGVQTTLQTTATSARAVCILKPQFNSTFPDVIKVKWFLLVRIFVYKCQKKNDSVFALTFPFAQRRKIKTNQRVFPEPIAV